MQRLLPFCGGGHEIPALPGLTQELLGAPPPVPSAAPDVLAVLALGPAASLVAAV